MNSMDKKQQPKNIDIVFPHNNEENFIKIAKKLGYRSLIFVYNSKDYSARKSADDFDIEYGILSDENNIHKSKKLASLVFVKAGDNPRHLIESNKNIIVFDFEKNPKIDMFTQRRSGLNHILCDLAAKNNIEIGFSFNSLIEADNKKRNILLGRITANIKLCKKYKNDTIFASFAKEPYEMRSQKDLDALKNYNF